MADPDSDLVLRLLKEQLKQSQQGSLENSKVLSALNRNPSDIGPWKTNVIPTPEIGPWKTNIIPGNPGQFSRPMPQVSPFDNIDSKINSPQGQQMLETLQGVDKLGVYTPGNRLSNNIEDRRQDDKTLNGIVPGYQTNHWNRQKHTPSNYSIPEIIKSIMRQVNGLNN